jgi:hypothetical protein
MRIDFAASTVTFSRGKVEPVADAIPMELDNGIPLLEVTLNDGVRTKLRLDTGASLFESTDVYINVTAPIWDELRKRDPALVPEQYFTGTGTGGQIDLAVARIEKLTIEQTTVSAPYVIVQPSQGYFARADSVGFLSNTLLEKFSPVTIDYPGLRLLLGARD